MLLAGDSIMATSVVSWPALAEAQISAAYSNRAHFIDNAVSGQPQMKSFPIFQKFLTAKYPAGRTFALWKNWSPNDGPNATQLDFDTYVQTVVDRCKASGLVPVLLTSPPAHVILTVAQDDARKAINAQTRALASDTVLIFDADALLSDGLSPASIPAAYSNDNEHPNAAGSAVLAQGLSALILEFLSTHRSARATRH